MFSNPLHLCGVEFDDHFVIRPTITFTEANNNYSLNNLGEIGSPVPEGFEYNSGRNERFLSVSEIVELNCVAGIE